MGILYFMLLIILVVTFISAYLISARIHTSLIKAGNKYPRAISAGIFVASFAIIGFTLFIIFMNTISFGR